jgi:glycosyltransferase involved in cell wall biosynthesis
MKKIALVISHPIQHFCPQYASLAKLPGIHLKVFFASSLGYKKYVDPNFKQEISWGNLRLEEFEHQFLDGGKSLPVGKELDAPGLETALTDFSPNLLIIHGYFQRLQRRAYRWGRRAGIPLAYTSDSERRHSLNPLKELIKYPYLWNLFKHIDYFFSVGDANESYYRHFGVPDEKMIRMHFSIDRQSYREAWPQRLELRSAVREKFGIPASEIVLSAVGKLVDWKRQRDIIAALKLLEARGLTATLFVIGSGKDQETLEKMGVELAHSRVIFPGFVKPEDLPGFYAASDIYVHPASIEPHSLAISEAIYMGCPVVLSDKCGSYGPDDDVQDGRNGFVFPCGNIEELARRLSSLITDASLRQQFSTRSHLLGEKFQERSHGGFIRDLLLKMK